MPTSLCMVPCRDKGFLLSTGCVCLLHVENLRFSLVGSVATPEFGNFERTCRPAHTCELGLFFLPRWCVCDRGYSCGTHCGIGLGHDAEMLATDMTAETDLGVRDEGIKVRPPHPAGQKAGVLQCARAPKGTFWIYF